MQSNDAGARVVVGTRVEGVTAGVGTADIAAPFGLAAGLRGLSNQVLFIAPLFWFMELLQNQVYWLLTGRYGWGYDPTPSGVPQSWYSLRSLPMWLVTVLVFGLLDRRFGKRRTPRPLQVAIAAGVGWAGEWATGYLSANLMHRPLQIWPGSPLVYVSISALPFWCANFVIFQRLVREIRLDGAVPSAARH